MDLADPQAFRPTLLGQRHMIVAGHPLAAMAGMRVLEAGGNAVDAGVAAGFALNVVQPDMANLGGVAPIMVRTAGDAAVTTIAGVGCWPMAVTRERLAASGGGRIPADARRWVVPAAVDAWLTALRRFGTWPAADVLRPAIELAGRGFPANYFIRHNLGQVFRNLPDAAHTREVFFPEGRVPDPGEPIRQAALADTLRRLCEAERRAGGTRAQGIQAARDAFYKGEIAARIGAFARGIGAFLTEADLNRFSVAEEKAVAVQFRGHFVHCCGPWSQGPALAQMLALADGFDLAAMSRDAAAHVLIECAKQALRDRNRHCGDPAFVDVPLGRLLSPDYAASCREGMQRACTRGDVPAPDRAPWPDTTYVCVVDDAGNAFSATPSDSTILVSPMVPGLGFGISDRGLQASLDPGDPNVVAPGKRPRLTPNPALAVGEGMVMPFGTPGGDMQTQAMLQFLVNHLAAGLDLQEAVEAPRWASFDVPATEDPHPAQPGVVRLESRADPEIFAGLRARGHDVRPWPALAALAGAVCAIRRDTRSGVLAGAADPRRMSYGLAW